MADGTLPSAPERRRRGNSSRASRSLPLWALEGRLPEKALNIQRQLLQAQPDDVGFRGDLADTYEAHAAVLEAIGRIADAEQEIRAALAIREALVAGRRASGK